MTEINHPRRFAAVIAAARDSMSFFRRDGSICRRCRGRGWIATTPQVGCHGGPPPILDCGACEGTGTA